MALPMNEQHSLIIHQSLEDSYPEDLDMNLYDRTLVNEQYTYHYQEAVKAYQLCRLARAFVRNAYARWLGARTRTRQNQQSQAAHSLEHKLHAQH